MKQSQQPNDNSVNVKQITNVFHKKLVSRKIAAFLPVPVL